VFAGPSAGFLIGWIIGALVIGLIVNAAKAKPGVLRLVLGLVVGGIGVVYLFGIPGMAIALGVGLDKAASIAAVYLVGDTIKVVVAAVVVLGLYRAYPKAFQN
jgi:biotin transport system substrate-specific component